MQLHLSVENLTNDEDFENHLKYKNHLKYENNLKYKNNLKCVQNNFKVRFITIEFCSVIEILEKKNFQEKNILKTNLGARPIVRIEITIFYQI
jgi:hypothetical protein